MLDPNPPVELSELVLAIQLDILEAIRDGVIPTSVQGFAELHNHCDANCLGGVCEDEKFKALVQQFGGRDKDDDLPAPMQDLITLAQVVVNRWIESGGHTILTNLTAQHKNTIQDALSNNEVSSDEELIEFWVSECGVPRDAANFAIHFRSKHLTDPFYQFFTYEELQKR